MMALEEFRRVRRSSTWRDLTGLRFASLLVLAEAGKSERGAYYWLCRCDCGTEKRVRGAELTSGGTKSCGCLVVTVNQRNAKHGQCRKTSEWRTWQAMMDRCYHNKNHRNFKDYGGRGIRVCERWRNSFLAFMEDMGPKPTPKHSIDRIDVNGNYEPTNCRWATSTEQARNTRRFRERVIAGEYKR